MGPMETIGFITESHENLALQEALNITLWVARIWKFHKKKSFVEERK